MATLIAAIFDPLHAEEREKRLDEIVSGLSQEEDVSYTQMCELLIAAIKEHMDDPCDILGGIYHELRLNNEWNGQSFRPTIYAE